MKFQLFLKIPPTPVGDRSTQEITASYQPYQSPPGPVTAIEEDGLIAESIPSQQEPSADLSLPIQEEDELEVAFAKQESVLRILGARLIDLDTEFNEVVVNIPTTLIPTQEKFHTVLQKQETAHKTLLLNYSTLRRAATDAIQIQDSTKKASELEVVLSKTQKSQKGFDAKVADVRKDLDLCDQFLQDFPTDAAKAWRAEHQIAKKQSEEDRKKLLTTESLLREMKERLVLAQRANQADPQPSPVNQDEGDASALSQAYIEARSIQTEGPAQSYRLKLIGGITLGDLETLFTITLPKLNDPLIGVPHIRISLPQQDMRMKIMENPPLIPGQTTSIKIPEGFSFDPERDFLQVDFLNTAPYIGDVFFRQNSFTLKPQAATLYAASPSVGAIPLSIRSQDSIDAEAEDLKAQIEKEITEAKSAGSNSTSSSYFGITLVYIVLGFLGLTSIFWIFKKKKGPSDGGFSENELPTQASNRLIQKLDWRALPPRNEDFEKKPKAEAANSSPSEPSSQSPAVTKKIKRMKRTGNGPFPVSN